MLPLFSSSEVIHDVLCLSIRCLIFPSLSVCTHAESGYEREAPFGPVWLVRVSSWSLMAVSVPDAAGRQTPHPLAPSPSHSSRCPSSRFIWALKRCHSHLRVMPGHELWGGWTFVVLYSVLFYSILFSYLHQETLCFPSLVHWAVWS